MKVSKKAIDEYMVIADKYWQETDTDKLPKMAMQKRATAEMCFGGMTRLPDFIDSSVRICPGVPVNTVCTMLRVLGVEVTDDGGV